MGKMFFSSCQKHCSSYTMAFKIKAVTEAEAVENNLEIAQDYGETRRLFFLARLSVDTFQ